MIFPQLFLRVARIAVVLMPFMPTWSPLRTSKVQADRLGLSGKDLSSDAKARKNRKKNPGGRDGGDYVYKSDDVYRIANQKKEPRRKPDPEEIRKKLGISRD